MRAAFRFVATLGPVGYFPVAPATAASAVTVLVAWFLPVAPLPVAIALLGTATVAAVFICHEAEKDLGHDAHPIVLDEVLGQSIALLGAPHTPPTLAISLLLFRLLDIWKPLGARRAQELPGGIGVVADDVIAGLVACGALHLGAWVLRSLPYPL